MILFPPPPFPGLVFSPSFRAVLACLPALFTRANYERSPCLLFDSSPSLLVPAILFFQALWFLVRACSLCSPPQIFNPPGRGAGSHSGFECATNALWLTLGFRPLPPYFFFFLVRYRGIDAGRFVFRRWAFFFLGWNAGWFLPPSFPSFACEPNPFPSYSLLLLLQSCDYLRPTSCGLVFFKDFPFNFSCPRHSPLCSRKVFADF